MLERYDGKRVRVTTNDGAVFQGEAETFPSGYALHEFDRQEECIRVEDIHIMLSQIAKIEEMDAEENLPPDRFQDLIGGCISVVTHFRNPFSMEVSKQGNNPQKQ